MTDCVHPLEKLKLWRVWTTNFFHAPNTKAVVTVVLECECGVTKSIEKTTES